MASLRVCVGLAVVAALVLVACGDSRCGAACGPAVRVRFAAPLDAPSYRASLTLDGRRVDFACASGAVTPAVPEVAACDASGFMLDAQPADLRATVTPASGGASRTAGGPVAYGAAAVCDFACDSATFVVP